MVLVATGQAPEPGKDMLASPIAVMEFEHDEAGRALETLRDLTDQYTAPDDACPAYQALLAGLADLERDLHQHIHKENNLLFPRGKQLHDQVRERMNRQGAGS